MLIMADEAIKQGDSIRIVKIDSDEVQVALATFKMDILGEFYLHRRMPTPSACSLTRPLPTETPANCPYRQLRMEPMKTTIS